MTPPLYIWNYFVLCFGNFDYISNSGQGIILMHMHINYIQKVPKQIIHLTLPKQGGGGGGRVGLVDFLFL